MIIVALVVMRLRSRWNSYCICWHFRWIFDCLYSRDDFELFNFMRFL